MLLTAKELRQRKQVGLDHNNNNLSRSIFQPNTEFQYHAFTNKTKFEKLGQTNHGRQGGRHDRLLPWWWWYGCGCVCGSVCLCIRVWGRGYKYKVGGRRLAGGEKGGRGASYALSWYKRPNILCGLNRLRRLSRLNELIQSNEEWAKEIISFNVIINNKLQ